MSNKLVVIHVGLAKTGSTFLQKQVFPKIKKGISLSIGIDHSDIIEFTLFLNRIQLPERGLHFSNKKLNSNPLFNEECKKYHKQKVKEALNKTEENILVSFEGIVGIPWSPLINNNDINMFLKEIYGNCKIIFVFRRQDLWAESLYKQKIFKENIFLKYISFEELFGNNKKSFVKYEELNWLKIYNNYKSIFGEKNVLALPYELLKESPEKFVEYIESFAQFKFDINESVFNIVENLSSKSPYYIETLYCRNPYQIPFLSYYIKKIQLRKPLSYLFTTKKFYKSVSDENKMKILLNQEKNNKILASITGFDLSKYGYYS